MTYFRRNWPNESITPKMHLLEDHCLPFIKMWGSGFGLYGEQGMESLHATFNSLRRSYTAMPVPTERLRSMMKEHFMRVNPDATSQKRFMATKKRKLLNKV